MTSKKILVVDDNHEIRDLLGQYLQQHGFQVTLSVDGKDMKNKLNEETFDLVILDIMLPGDDGLTLCRYIKETTRQAVILLTAMADEADCVIGLELGADDYITKPFTPRVLLARIKAVMRRTQSQDPAPLAPQNTDEQYVFSGWRLDKYQRHLIREDGLLISLSNAEFTLLKVFLNNPKKVLSRDHLLNLTKGVEATPFDRSVDNQISRLRKKIEKKPNDPSLIKTVWGGGYLFSSNVSLM